MISMNIENYNHPTYKKQQKSTANKVLSLTGSIVGVSMGLSNVLKKHNLKSDVFTRQISTKSVKKLVKNLKNVEFNGKDVIKIASSSVAGGLVAGIVTDSDHTKAKIKESSTQLLGNYFIPTIFVEAGIRLNKFLNNKYHFPPVTKPIQFAFGLGSLIAGIVLGNKILGKVNGVIFNDDNARKLGWQDYIQQVDNVCLTASLATTGTDIAKKVSKIIPLAHIIPGYCVGTKKDENNGDFA